jgi:hypothetical protein
MGRDRAELAAEGPDGRTHGAGDNDVGHENLLGRGKTTTDDCSV